jgi:hypothetical protein
MYSVLQAQSHAAALAYSFSWMHFGNILALIDVEKLKEYRPSLFVMHSGNVSHRPFFPLLVTTL